MTAPISPLRTDVASDYWLKVLSGERRGAGYSAMRAVLTGFAGAYAIGLEGYLAAERLGLRRRTMLPAPVISIGNLSSGGAGKTPMTHLVAEGLARDGFRPAILSRGHGGSLSRAAVQVSDSSGDLLRRPAEVGDEAVVLSMRTPGVPVFVGRDRRKTGALASRLEHPGVFVLDDGFQYWQLARDLDIVLIDSRRPFDNGYPLPRGLLREPKRHLRRAGMVVVTRADLAAKSQLDVTLRAVERLAPDASVFMAYHRFGGLRPLNASAEGRLPSRALAVCGIAQPDSFLSLLRGAGVPLTAEMVALPDHAVYDERTVSLLKGKISEQDADSLIATEKDAVKLDADDFGVPVYAMTLRMEIDRYAGFWSELMNRSGLVTAAGSAKQ